jgi:aquaporin Z
MTPKLAAECLGTFWLVLGGCGSAVLAAAFPELGIGLAGVSLVFGLTVLTGAYALGPISGGHFNPAVSLGLWAGGLRGSGDWPGLTLIHLISIPVTNTSVNPARSTGPALYVGGWALEQLWRFWVAPIVGAVAAGWFSRALFDSADEPAVTGR